MNSIKTVLATLAFATVASSALATEGLPPNLQATQGTAAISIEGANMHKAPQYLHGQGEISLVPNPAFNVTPASSPVQMGRSAPIRDFYVGA